MKRATNQYDQTIKNLEASVLALKDNAKAELQQTMAQIGQARGEYQLKKGEMINDAMSIYRQTIADINARNTAYTQKVALQAQEAQNQLNMLVTRAREGVTKLQFQKLADTLGKETAYTFNPVTGETTPVSYAPTTLSSTGGVGTVGGMTEDEKLLEQIRAEQ